MRRSASRVPDDDERDALIRWTRRALPQLIDRACPTVLGALESGQLAGYAGDVWYPQPPAEDDPWRTMPNNAMTPHISGSSLSAQARYAAGTREILEDSSPEGPSATST